MRSYNKVYNILLPIWLIIPVTSEKYNIPEIKISADKAAEAED